MGFEGVGWIDSLEPIESSVWKKRAGMSGDSQHFDFFPGGDVPEGFAKIIDVVADRHSSMLPHGIVFCKGFGHDSQQFDPLKKYVVQC
jgi:hypothetical protein